MRIVSDFRKNVQEAAEGIILPPPPAAEVVNALNPNLRHGVIDKPDPHRVAELENLNAQIELDQEIERIRDIYSQSRILLYKIFFSALAKPKYLVNQYFFLFILKETQIVLLNYFIL